MRRVQGATALTHTLVTQLPRRVPISPRRLAETITGALRAVAPGPVLMPLKPQRGPPSRADISSPAPAQLRIRLLPFPRRLQLSLRPLRPSGLPKLPTRLRGQLRGPRRPPTPRGPRLPRQTPRTRRPRLTPDARLLRHPPVTPQPFALPPPLTPRTPTVAPPLAPPPASGRPTPQRPLRRRPPLPPLGSHQTRQTQLPLPPALPRVALPSP